MVPKKIARTLIYVGPILIFYLYNKSHGKMISFLGQNLFNDSDYLNTSHEQILIWEPGKTERMATNMILLHFLRKIVETLLFERLAGHTMTLTEIFWQFFLYWCLLGMSVGYAIFHTEYKAPFFLADEDNTFVQTIFCYALFGLGQVMNGLSHHHYHQ